MSLTELEKVALSPEQLRKINAYWRAANYLSVGQIYLCDNPLLRGPLKLEHVKQLLLGHWGTTPGQNFIYAHLNRVIKEHDLNMIYMSGPGHGAPAVVGNVYLEGSYSEVYPKIGQDEAGLKRLFQQFSFPGGISSHVSPQTPGSIHEGGELGYSVSHAFGAAFDNPDLVVACVVGDARPRPARWPPPGIPTSSSTPSATAWSCRSSTSTASRSPSRRSWPGSPTKSWRACSSATAGRLTSSKGSSRRRCTRRWPRPSIGWSNESSRSSTTPASKATPLAPAGR